MSPLEKFIADEVAKNGREPDWKRRCLELHQRAEFLDSEDVYLRSELSKSQARVAQLEEKLADRTEKYKIAMDKGLDVLSYQLGKAENVLKEFSLGESQWLDGVECMHKAREYFRTKESQGKDKNANQTGK